MGRFRPSKREGTVPACCSISNLKKYLSTLAPGALGGAISGFNWPCRGREKRIIHKPEVPHRKFWFNVDPSQNRGETMSHHYSGPDFGFPHGDARLDFTDLYAFPKPGDAGKSILIMNVHPSVGVNPPGPTTVVAFSPEAIYELRIDTNGDNVADIAYRVRFTSSKDGAQIATLRRAEGAQAASTGDDGQIIVEGVPVSTGQETRATEAGDYRFFAGWRGDPFFFDVEGALNNLQFTG